MLVLLYVHDALRHDYVSCYGFMEDTTPYLDEFAKEGVRFSNAFSQSTWTKASAASLLTGLYPSALGALGRFRTVPEPAFWLLGSLRETGLRTVAISGNPFVSARFGFDAGFDEIVDVSARQKLEPSFKRARGRMRLGRSWPARRLSRLLTGRRRRELRKEAHRAGTGHLVVGPKLNEALFQMPSVFSSPSLVVLWSMDTHDPYFDRDLAESSPENQIYLDARELARSDPSLVRELYRGMVRYADRQFGDLIDRLKERGEYDSAMIIVTSDHGESLGEHGQFSHFGIPFEEQTHVPLVVKFPQGRFAGSVNEELTELVDLMPTVADLLRSDFGGSVEWSEKPLQGRSLLPHLRGEEQGRPFVYTEVDFTETGGSAGYPTVASLRGHEWQYMRFTLPDWKDWRNWISAITRTRLRGDQFFDLRQDPASAGNLIRTGCSLPTFVSARDELDALMKQNLELKSAWQHLGRNADLDGAVKERLTALGYLD